MNFPVFDLHCDTALALLDRGFRVDKQLKTNALHIDLDRASRLPGYCQCFACFTTPWQNLPEGVAPQAHFQVSAAGCCCICCCICCCCIIAIC